MESREGDMSVLGDSGDTVEDGTMLQRAWQRSLDSTG